MHCPSCNRTLAAGTKCPKCGKLAVASSVDEIDLMPLDEPKVAGAAAFQPPPEAFLPPPTMPGKGSKKKALAAPGELPPMEEPLRIRAGALAPKATKTNKLIGVAVLLMLLLFIAWRMFRTENKVLSGDPVVENKTLSVPPNQALVRNLEVSGTVSWKFEVTAMDDTVLVGVVHRSAKDPQTLAALKQLPDTAYEIVKKGETHPMSGDWKTGTYSWVVLNENKKAVRVKVKFKAQP